MESYPHLAHDWRYEQWSRQVERKVRTEKELKEMDERARVRGEMKFGDCYAYKSEVGE